MSKPDSDNASPWDALIIGAGHNGLATATVLAKQGRKVLVLEKNKYVGGMGGTREILKGCRNEVGASCLFPLSKEIKDYFDFEAHGVELIPLPIMAVNLTGAEGRPLLFYKNPAKLAFGLLKNFGFGAMLGFIRLMKFCQYPAQILDRFTARKAPRNLEDLIREAPTAAKRAQLELAFKGSAMDIINKFFPDPVKHRELRANMAFAAVQATYKGPYTPGSGLCLIYTFAQEGSEGLMQRVRGGMGKLSESLVTQIEAAGGEVRLGQRVQKILVEGETAVGVELKNGEQIRAAVVVSNLDKPATFNHLLTDYPLPPEVKARVDGFEHQGAFVHTTRFGGAMVIDPEAMQDAFEACERGQLPRQIPLAFQIPTVMDATLAPEGYHIASAYGFYFPCNAEKSLRGKLRDQMGELIIDHICMHMPAFRELVVDQAIFSSDHFASMHGVTNGDWTHGLLHPDQMIGERCLLEGSGHTTPVKNLFLCGASCHPGPGVTFLPGYNCAFEVMQYAQTDRTTDTATPSATRCAA